MSSSGARHFTDKAQLLFNYRDVVLQVEERDELAHRMVVPFKSFRSTKFVTKELANIKRVREEELKKQHSCTKIEKACNSNLKPNTNQTTGAPVSGEQTTSNKRKRSPTDDDSIPKAKIQKLSPKSGTLESQGSPNFAIERLEQVIELTEKINTVSKRYNGPDGKVIPPTEYNLSLQQQALLVMANNSSTPDPASAKRNIKRYEKKLCNKIREIIISWTEPSTKTTRRPHGDVPQHLQNYGHQKENALAYIIRTFWAYPEVLLKTRCLYEQIPKAEDQDLEALATTIESWVNSIFKEKKKGTFTQEELIIRNPEIGVEKSIKRNKDKQQKDHTWQDWNQAKKASLLAKEAETAKNDIAKHVRDTIAKYGDHPLPAGTTPLDALPLHIRRRMKKLSKKGRGDGDCFMGDVVPAGGFSLGIYAQTMGRSKLSNIVAGAGSDCENTDEY
ncbi:hypothetical protein IFR05_004820 [Cadophora sp. M221]|nr:hypothetical protein IFR05_004820 [Cadophora sp. M221]